MKIEKDAGGPIAAIDVMEGYRGNLELKAKRLREGCEVVHGEATSRTKEIIAFQMSYLDCLIEEYRQRGGGGCDDGVMCKLFLANRINQVRRQGETVEFNSSRYWQLNLERDILITLMGKLHR